MRGSKKLKAWRDRKGLSQTEAAEMFGTKQGVWGAWERDEKRPDLAAIFALEALTEGEIAPRDWLGPRTGKKSTKKKPATSAAAE